MIEKLYNLLTSLGVTHGHDKVLHWLIGLLIGAISSILFADSILMVLPVMAIGVGKELYDKYIKKTHFDFFDMFATLLGGAVGIMLVGLVG